MFQEQGIRRYNGQYYVHYTDGILQFLSLSKITIEYIQVYSQTSFNHQASSIDKQPSHFIYSK